MSDLRELEIIRLMRELQFVESDFIYRSEFMRVAENEFLQSIDMILSKFPELKNIYNKKLELNIPVIDQIESINTDDESVQEKSLDSKKIYRDIVKSTHPDKVNNSRLNDLYLEATTAYEQNDIVTLYKVCSELNIRFDLSDDYLNLIKEKINTYLQRSKFLENTYTSKWLKADVGDKDKILIEFIRNKII